MAYAMTKQGSLDNCVTYEFVCDTVNDMNAIENKYRTIGTVAIVLKGSNDGLEVYIAGSNKQWNSLSNIGGGSNSDSNSIQKPDVLQVNFTLSDGTIVGDTSGGEIYGAFMSGTTVIFSVPIDEDVYINALLTSAGELPDGSYIFQTDSDTTEYAHFMYEATTENDFPVLTSE